MLLSPSSTRRKTDGQNWYHYSWRPLRWLGANLARRSWLVNSLWLIYFVVWLFTRPGMGEKLGRFRLVSISADREQPKSSKKAWFEDGCSSFAEALWQWVILLAQKIEFSQSILSQNSLPEFSRSDCVVHRLTPEASPKSLISFEMLSKRSACQWKAALNWSTIIIKAGASSVLLAGHKSQRDQRASTSSSGPF